MLKVIWLLYQLSSKAVTKGIPISQVKDEELFQEVIQMKYTIPNDFEDEFELLSNKIKNYYEKLRNVYK